MKCLIGIKQVIPTSDANQIRVQKHVEKHLVHSLPVRAGSIEATIAALTIVSWTRIDLDEVVEVL